MALALPRAATALACLAGALCRGRASAPRPAGTCRAVAGAALEDDAVNLMQLQVAHRLSRHGERSPPQSCEEKFENASYRFWCDPDNATDSISFADGNCAFVIKSEPKSCNQFCRENGNRKCYAAAASEGGCDWKPQDPDAGTADFCNRIVMRAVCVCSEELLESSTTGPPDEHRQCANAFEGTFKAVCDQGVMNFSGGNCPMLVQTEDYNGSNCDGYCRSHDLPCYAAAANRQGCSGWKMDETDAGTAAYCSVAANRQVCVCDQSVATPAPTGSPTGSPTKAPTQSPTPSPTPSPTAAPTLDACGGGYELQGYPTDDDTAGYYYCQNWDAGTGTPPTTEHAVSAGTAGIEECRALCNEDSTCTHFAKYGAYCDGPCRTGWEKKCFLIRQCGELKLKVSTGDYGAVYCERSATPSPTPSPTADDWCTKDWRASEFSKCDYWGDPHFKKTFSGGQYDVMGEGVFLVAGTKSDYFEVQNFQCPWGRKPQYTLAVGIAVRFGNDTVVVGSADNRMWINGEDKTTIEHDSLTAIGLITKGDMADTSRGGGLQVMSSDCKHRFMSVKKVGSVHPGFSFGGVVRVPSEDELADGMCTGCEHQQHLGASDLLFTQQQIELFCSYCLASGPGPDICNASAPLPPTPVPVDPPCVDPPHPCEDADNSEGCGLEAAEEACKALEGTECFEGCVFDFCAGDCQETGETDDCIEEPPEPPVTLAPTPSPTQSPASFPTPSPTLSPTTSPTGSPTGSPTKTPTQSPTPSPTQSPTLSPTLSPTETPTQSPSELPSTTSPQPETTARPTTTPGVTGDPHVTNVDGQRFNLNRVGVHELLRLPRRSGRDAARDDAVLLEVLGTVESERRCEEPFVRRLDVGGLWLSESGPLVFGAHGQRRDSEGSVMLMVNGSHVSARDIGRDARLRGLLEASAPKAARPSGHGDLKIRRDKLFTVKMRFPRATLRVDWIHRRVPGSALNHLDFHVSGLPRPGEGPDVGGILGRDSHASATSSSEGCAPSGELRRGGRAAGGAAASVLKASYARA